MTALPPILNFTIPCPPLAPEDWTDDAIEAVAQQAAEAARVALRERLGGGEETSD